MVCTICRDPGHNSRTMREVEADPLKRGARDSPNTPVDQAKLAKLVDISKKMSPKQVPPMPELMPQDSGAAGNNTQTRQDPLLAAIGKQRLSAKMNTLATKVDLEDCTMIGKTKSLICEAVDPLKAEMHSLQTRVTNLEKNPIQSKGDQDLRSKVEGIETQLADMKLTTTAKDLSTALVGVHGASSAEAAKALVSDTMGKAGIDGIADVYDKCKGDPFNGMVFVKFSSTEKRDAAIKTFNDTRSSFSDSRAYMNRDLPIKQRISFSFLLDLKKLLVEWKLEKVSFDDGSGIMSVGGLPVLRVVVVGSSFQLIWIEKGWGEWEELTNDPKLKGLVAAAEGKLTKAAQNSVKGKGKPGSA